MNRKTVTINDRNYAAWTDGEHEIIIGPPEELVDSLGFQEPFATRLHNILHARGLLTYQDVSKKQKELVGALQEAILVDAQIISQAYYRLSQEAHHG